MSNTSEERTTRRERMENAYRRWLDASEEASSLSSELFQPGSGYGDPEARTQAVHKLDSARREAERLFREYNELYRRLMEGEMLALQRSQRTATWASFFVAAVVGLATVVQVIVLLTS